MIAFLMSDNRLNGIASPPPLPYCSAGLVKVVVVALDGTKIKGAAALSTNRTQKHIKKEVAKIFRETKAKNEEENALFGKDKRGDEMPKKLQGKENQLKRLQEAKERLEREA